MSQADTRIQLGKRLNVESLSHSPFKTFPKLENCLLLDACSSLVVTKPDSNMGALCLVLDLHTLLLPLYSLPLEVFSTFPRKW